MDLKLEAALRKARRYAAAGLPFPLDLYAYLLGMGVDVEALERKYA